MKRDEWAKFHGFNDDDMSKIDFTLKLFGGKIISIIYVDKTKQGAILNSEGGNKNDAKKI